MYELTLSADDARCKWLSYVDKRLSVAAEKVHGLRVSATIGSRHKVSFVCGDVYAEQFREEARQALCDVLAVGCKNEFLHDCFSHLPQSLASRTLVDAMCIFDAAADKKYLTDRLVLTAETCIDGCCDFRLKPLKRKWREAADLIKRHDAVIKDDEISTEFLRYLLGELPSSVGALSVVFCGCKTVLFDSQNHVLPSVDTVVQVDAYEEAMFNALCLNPSKVIVYGDGSEGCTEFVSLCKRVFPTEIR